MGKSSGIAVGEYLYLRAEVCDLCDLVRDVHLLRVFVAHPLVSSSTGCIESHRLLVLLNAMQFIVESTISQSSQSL